MSGETEIAVVAVGALLSQISIYSTPLAFLHKLGDLQGHYLFEGGSWVDKKETLTQFTRARQTTVKN